MSRVLVSALLVFALAACGKSDNATDAKTATAKTPAGQPPAVKPVEGPILDMVVAGSIDAKGSPVGQTFTFPPDQPQITVIARIGKVADGSSIRFAWYLETDGEDKALFDQNVKVASFDRAYSEGKNPGTLAAGRYKVVVALDGTTREIEFAVALRSGKSTPRTVSGSSFEWLAVFGVHAARAEGISVEPGPSTALVADSRAVPARGLRWPKSGKVNWQLAQNTNQPTSNQAPQANPGSPPIAGASGAVNAVRPVPNPLVTAGDHDQLSGFGESGDQLHDDSTDRIAGLVEYEVSPMYAHGYQLSQFSTSMNGSAVAYSHYVLGFDRDWPTYNIDPCTLPRGSDLPGTRIDVSSTYTDSQQRLLTYTGLITLGEDTLAPGLHVDSTPPKGAKVNAGQKIDIAVTASEKRSDGPWQTGVRWIQVTSPAGLVGSWDNPSRLPQACAKKTWDYTYKTTYVVPTKPPLLIKLCAITQDYADNENSKCANFLTGDVWNGTWHQDSNRSYRVWTTGEQVMQCNDAWDGTLSFAVGADGVLEGTAIAKLASGPTCMPDRSYVEKVQEITYTVSGHKTPTGFELYFKFDHNTPKGGNLGGNVMLLGTHNCVSAEAQPPPVLLDHSTANNVASGRFTATGSPLCGGSKSDVLAVDAHLEVTRR